MTQEVLGETEVRGLRRRESATGKEALKFEPVNKVMAHFQKQQESNLLIKEAMARELAAMELSEEAILQVLHLEDDLSF